MPDGVKTGAGQVRMMLAAAAVLAFAVIVLGAYVRLSDAGLACPDWPSCHGYLIGVPDQAEDGAYFDRTKAWIEVSHRYLAAALGLLIAAAAAAAYVRRAPRPDRIISLLLLALVVCQALLGALTVSELLKPIIVAAHLLGGMAILALLSAYCARVFARQEPPDSTGTLRVVLAVALVAGFVQLALGVWVSANYAGAACGTGFPSCNGDWAPAIVGDAFAIERELGFDVSGRPLTAPALIAVHWVHRLGAFGLAILGGVASWLLFASGFRRMSAIVAAALAAQIMLGILTVTTALSLPIALLHNAGAAVLIGALSASAARTFPTYLLPLE